MLRRCAEPNGRRHQVDQVLTKKIRVYHKATETVQKNAISLAQRKLGEVIPK